MQLAGGLSIRALKKITSIEKDLSSSRRAQKRKLTQQEEDSSCCSSDEDDDEDDEPSTDRGGKTLLHQQAHRNTVLSPASSSCHSSTTSSCVPAAPPGIASSAGGLVITAEPNCVSPKPSVQHDDTDGGGGGTSVKDLEHAMSKHLPVVSLGKGATASSPPLSLQQQHQPTDFSTDALLKQQQQRSTIQWIGAHHHHLNHLNHHQQLQHSQGASAPLPASALLRQLYANRESVIRANVHAATSGMTSSTGRGAGSAAYYAGDVNQVGPLPTPPGSEGSTYGDHQFVLSHNQKSGAGIVNGGADAFSSLVSSYSTGGYSVDYHSAMTPPSSVSPRDKHQQQIHPAGAFDSPVYSDVLRHQYLGGGGTGGGTDGTPAQPLPLKPQVYSAVHPSALDAAAAYAASTSLDQSQFYHHSAAGAGFHLYHPATNKTVTATATVYPEALKNSANWYSTAS